MMKRKLEEVDTTHEKAIYRPFFLGLAVQVVAVLLVVLLDLREVTIIMMGLGSIIMASSGYWQVKHRFVPGFPALRGGCAVAFGIFFILLFSAIGLVLVFFTIFPER